jgi:hypothetical protein
MVFATSLETGESCLLVCVLGEVVGSAFLFPPDQAVERIQPQATVDLANVAQLFPLNTFLREDS